MSLNKYINIMISSKNKSKFDNKILTAIRKDLKKFIENTKIFGEKIFEITINEDLESQEASKDTWKVCMEMVDKCDIFLCLYNGESGWSVDDGEIGICHDELRRAYNIDASKVFIVDIGIVVETKSLDQKQIKRDQRFQKYVERLSTVNCSNIIDIETLKKCISKILVNNLIKYVTKEIVHQKEELSHRGEALDWNKLNFYKRSEKIKNVLLNSIEERANYTPIKEDSHALKFEDENLLLKVHSIPASFSIGAAREMVGQPFLEEHKLINEIDDDFIGPVHIIGCHKAITESQAMKTLGFPDAMVLKTHFGVYVADNVQKIQMIFISNCIDTEHTRSGFQQMYLWLENTDEIKSLLNRARARKEIISKIAEFNNVK